MCPVPDAEPLAYYHPAGPAGDVFEAFGEVMPKKNIAVVSLGTGSLASYGRADQHFTFYEIDPVVVQLATDEELFTYLKDCKADYDIVLGDGRIEIAKAPDKEFDILVMDAFSSDSRPFHLLTREAISLYVRKLKDDGIIAYNISNRYLDLKPMLARLAYEAGLICLSRQDYDVSDEYLRQGKAPSHFIVMARHESDIGKLASNGQWEKIDPPEEVSVWRDDYSNIRALLRWGK
jgi:hypothetical protein